MKIFCETVFSDMLPAVRAIVTNELIQTYGLTQNQVAQKLGITQPAVSQYLNGLRGKRVKLILSNEKTMEFIKKLSSEIVSGSTKLHENVCEICGMGRKDLYYDKELHPFICLIDTQRRSK